MLKLSQIVVKNSLSTVIPLTSVVSIVEKSKVNHDSYIYRLKFETNPFQLKIGQHFSIIKTLKKYSAPQGEQIVRKYTPINPCSQKNFMDLLIKIYRPNENIRFPNGGKLTPYIQSLNVGDRLNIQGPLGKFGYEANGNIITGQTQKQYKKIFMVAGGTGITPCFQVINQIAKMSRENIKLTLIYGNKTVDDILLKQQLEKLKNRVEIVYALQKFPENWQGQQGLINEAMLKKYDSLNDFQTLYIHCGPFGMNKWFRNLFQKQFPQSQLFKF